MIFPATKWRIYGAINLHGLRSSCSWSWSWSTFRVKSSTFNVKSNVVSLTRYVYCIYILYRNWKKKKQKNVFGKHMIVFSQLLFYTSLVTNIDVRNILSRAREGRMLNQARINWHQFAYDRRLDSYVRDFAIAGNADRERAVAWIVCETSMRDVVVITKMIGLIARGINCASRQDNRCSVVALWILIVSPKCDN